MNKRKILFIALGIIIVAMVVCACVFIGHTSNTQSKNEMAYQYVAKKGYNKTAREWLLDVSVEHKEHKKSAYNKSVDNGYSDNVENWITNIISNEERKEEKRNGYDVALEYGFTGTEKQFIEIFKKSNYCKKKDVSSYELAKENGFSGTIIDWLDLLVNSNIKNDKTLFELGNIKNKSKWIAEFVINNNIYPNEASLYDISVINGFDGDFTSWLSTLASEDDLNSNEDFTLYKFSLENGFDGSYYEWAEYMIVGDENDKSAYELMTENNYNETIENWVILLKTDYKDSSKVFDYVQKRGFDGTEKDFINIISNRISSTNNAFKKAADNGFDSTEETFYQEIIDVLNGSKSIDDSLLNGIVKKIELKYNIIIIYYEDSSIKEIEINNDSNNELFIVIFKDFDDSIIDLQIVSKGNDSKLPSAPYRSGYDFEKWDTNYKNITQNTVIKAVYSESKGPAFLVENINASAGAFDVIVPVSVRNNPGILGAKLSIKYDDSVMTLKSLKNGKAFANAGLTLTKAQTLDSPCTICWDGIDLSENQIEDGDILLLTFDIASNAEKGNYSIEINYDKGNIVDYKLQEVNVAVTNGSIMIN